MAGVLANPYSSCNQQYSHRLYSKEELEQTPSRRDGISSAVECSLRKTYCTFLLNMGKRLRVPQFSVATATIFCHRFFLLQSHAKNNTLTIATACMFLAGKADDRYISLRDIISFYYETLYKRDSFAAQKIKQKEVYEQQKQLILLGERVILVTLGFDLVVEKPFETVLKVAKKFKSKNNLLVQYAWNFVNDGLWALSWLQFESHHIAAGALFLATKFLKVRLPLDGDKRWWLALGLSTFQLEVVSNHLLSLHEGLTQVCLPPPPRKKVIGSFSSSNVNQPTRKTAAGVAEKSTSTSDRPSQPARNNFSESSLSVKGDQFVPHYVAAKPTNGHNLVESQAADLRSERESGAVSKEKKEEVSKFLFVGKESTSVRRSRNESNGVNKFCVNEVKINHPDKVNGVLKRQRENGDDAIVRKLDSKVAYDAAEKVLENGVNKGNDRRRLRKSLHYDDPPNGGRTKHSW